METQSKNRKLVLPLILLASGAIVGIANIISSFLPVNDFLKGFLSGIAITLLVGGIITLIKASIQAK